MKGLVRILVKILVNVLVTFLIEPQPDSISFDAT
jgi:hypothetical protein